MMSKNQCSDRWVRMLQAAREFDPRAEAELVQRWLSAAPPHIFAAALNSRDAGLFLATKLDDATSPSIGIGLRLRTWLKRLLHRACEDAIAANNSAAAYAGSAAAVKDNARLASNVAALERDLSERGVPAQQFSMHNFELTLSAMTLVAALASLAVILAGAAQ